MTVPQLTAFIPLKGHSARVPGKNLRPFNGVPLFQVILHTLQTATHVGDVYVDTDSDEIGEAVRREGGIVLTRKAHLEGDDTSVNWLIKDFLVEHPDATHVIQTHSTNPLLRSDTIDAAVEAYFENDGCTSLFSVTRHQARFYRSDLTPVNHDPSVLLKTQDLPPLLEENSNLYIFQRDAFFENDTRITSRPMLWEMDALEAVDIDDEADFVLAELLAKRPE